MSLPRPIRPYHFQADLIWWDSPFKVYFYLNKREHARFYVIVPDRASGYCPDPESWELFLGKCGGGYSSQARPGPAWCGKKAAVETQQQWRKCEQGMLPPISRCDTAESKANRVRTLCPSIHHNSAIHLIVHYVCVVVWVCNYCISSRRINHRDALIHALILYLQHMTGVMSQTVILNN
jgi:hypothetical protein